MDQVAMGWFPSVFYAKLIILLIPTLNRIRVEQKVLLQIFGVEYRAYMNRTWRLIPGW